MGKMYRIEKGLPLLLITAILILCVGFFVVSCGNKPQQKTVNTNKDAYALDLSVCPTNNCFAFPEGSVNTPVPSINGRALTIEAWIKNKVTSTSGGIFGRYDSFGAALYIKDGQPKFGIGRYGTSTVIEPSGCTYKAPTSTECVLNSNVTPAANAWTHVAGVLVNEAHSHTVSASCTNAVMLETPHMDIYINGVFADCATTGSQFAGNPGDNKMSIGVAKTAGELDGLGTSKFNVVIDEIRFWGYARTPSQINECKGTELGVGGVCDRGDSGLIGYYRLNEGSGHDVSDFSKNGFSGALEDTNADHFDSGWVLRTDSLTPTRAD